MEKRVDITPSPKMMVPIIKVVGNFCNLRCKYCFYSTTNQSKAHCMSYELLEKFLVEYFQLFTKHPMFIWHGGEPLLAGLSFFEKIVEIQSRVAKNNSAIQNFIQTNATLVNKKWARFFKKHNFKVGVSLDGNEKSHNQFRKDSGGKGSFNQVMRGIKILRDYGINPGIIQTLTVNNLSQTKENFDFFTNVAKVKGWSTNIYLDINNTNKAMLGQGLTNKQLSAFLIEQINLWLEYDSSQLKIREIENFISAMFNKKASSCAFNGLCDRYFCLEYDGKIYPCDRSSGNPDLLLGDISEQSLAEILSGNKRLDYARKTKNLPSKCLSCEWQKSCNNGCTMHRVGGIDGDYYFCHARQEVFSYLRDKMKKLNFGKTFEQKGGDKSEKRNERITRIV